MSTENELKILGLLETLVEKVDRVEARVASLEVKVDRLEARVASLEAKVDEVKRDTEAITEQTANLTEFKTEIRQKVDGMVVVLKANTYDVTLLREKVAGA